jgi:hypothetical protein
LFDLGSADRLPEVDPIRLLEAVRRHADHTTVFCQAGAIHVPSQYRSILTFTEDSVLEVMPLREGTIFHPKVWALRFVDPQGRRLHRVVILSRNMTLDRCWDTALVLDEEDGGEIDAAPAAEFVKRLPDLAIQPLADARAQEIEQLAQTLSKVWLAAPSPFIDGELLPIGLNNRQTWPFPDRARRLLAISPFLTRPALRALATMTSNRTLVSRAEALELIGSKHLEGWSVNVLQRLAEVDPGEDATEAVRAISEFQEASQGLHAKTFIVDLADRRSMVVTGSANLTSERWGNSIEFDAILTGPTWACGVEAVLSGSAEVPGLIRLLEEYSVSTEAGVTDAAIHTSYVLDQFHRQLAVNAPNLHVTPVEADRVQATLTLTVPVDAPGHTSIWLASLPADIQRQDLAATLSWAIAAVNITPFVAVETTAGEGNPKVTRRCVLKATLTGANDTRRQDAVFSILRSKEVAKKTCFAISSSCWATRAMTRFSHSWPVSTSTAPVTTVDRRRRRPTSRCLSR